MFAICVCLLVIIIMLSGCTVSGNGKAEKVRQGMTAFLQDRYGIEFEVGQPYLTGSMSTTHYQAKAHPKGKPEIEFIINDDSYMDEMGSGVYADYYLTAKWSYQGRQEVGKKIREVYGEGVDFNISFYEFFANAALKDLDYAQAFEKSYGHGITELHYEVFMGGAQFNKEEEAEKAYRILKYFILDHGGGYSFSVTYINKAFKQDYLENRSRYVSVEKPFHEMKLLNFLQIGYVSISESNSKVINESSDIIKYYKY